MRTPMTSMLLALLAGLGIAAAAGCAEPATRRGGGEGEGEGEGEGSEGEGEGSEGEGEGRPPRDAGLDGEVLLDAGDPEPEPPPVICKAAPFPEVRFVRATDRWGIGRDGLAVDGIRVMLADLDGDGYPDLIVHGSSHLREDRLAAPLRRLRWVLLNRPAADGTGLRRFVDATTSSGYQTTRDAGEGRACSLAVAGDVDNDGDLDLFSGVYTESLAADDPGDRSEVLLNRGDGTFVLGPAGAAAGPGPRATTAAAFLDFDRDGLLDLFVGGFYGTQDELYRGLGEGRFQQVTHQVGLTATSGGELTGTNARPTYGVTACDVDDDGDADLLVSAYGRQWNQLWLNEDGSFREVGQQVGFAGDALRDYSDDEFYHCYCATSRTCSAATPRISCTGGGWSWTPGVDDHPFRLNGNSFTTVCGDLDGDERPDLLTAEIRHWHSGTSSDPTEILFNLPEGAAGFRFDRPGNLLTGLHRPWRAADWNEGDITASFADFDGDGQLDVFVGSSDHPGTRAFLWRQQSPGFFKELAESSGLSHPWAVGHAWGDLDGDGDLDLVIASSVVRGGPWASPEVHVYENQGAESKNWLRVALVGGGAGRANRSAIGARVTLAAGVRRQQREVAGGYGHFGLQHDLTLHFGLGSVCAVDSLTVRWPDRAGTVEVFRDVRANYRIEIRQGEGLRYVREPPPVEP